MFDWIADPSAWMALVTLTALEIVLGIDNIIFISILTGKLPMDQQPRARVFGLGLAMFSRLLLLFSLKWIMGLSDPFITIHGHGVSWRDVILFGGGLFLIGKSTVEIHEKLEGEEESSLGVKAAVSFGAVLFQIMLLDIVFSLDSVITAVGMADRLSVMSLAIIIAVGFMMLASGTVSRFVEDHPTVKVLALSFLILIGVSLMGEGLHFHIPKGYIYFSMAFSVCVELLNQKLRRKAPNPVKLHGAARS